MLSEWFSTTVLATGTVITLSCTRCSQCRFPLFACAALCFSLLLLLLYLRLCDTECIMHQWRVAMNWQVESKRTCAVREQCVNDGNRAFP